MMYGVNNGASQSSETNEKTKRYRKTSTWSKTEVQVLIQESEKRPCLWDTSRTDYRDRNIRTKNIQEIALVLNKEVEDINNKWQNLRNQFGAERRKCEARKSGSSLQEVYDSKWEYFQAMKFILPACVSTQGISPLEIEIIDGNIEFDAVTETPLPRTPKRKQNRQDSGTQKEALLSKALSLMQKPVDSEQIFGDYVADKLRRAKGIKKKRFRKAVERLMAELSESGDDDDDDVPPILLFNDM
ncbi:hypothetical protein R5R35_004673 [Gryllus longicercus]|uniref:MADF domain-containing protein n=1 Tax=Gryllus longicercus TaxID=2509291 RepID=A0AAN9W6U4_9ORTH